MGELPRSQSRSDDQLVMLFFIHIKVFLFQSVEFLRVFCRYYRSGKFLLADFLLGSRYFFWSPFQVYKRFFQGQSVGPYGETPLTTMDHIAKECRLLKKDVVYELGCGTGRTCLWLSTFVGCQTYGIDLVADFISHAERAKKWSGIDRAHFYSADFFSFSFQDATAIYLYGTTLSQEAIDVLLQKMKRLKKNTKVITASFPLIERGGEEFFRLEKQFSGIFPWGKADVYLNVRL